MAEKRIPGEIYSNIQKQFNKVVAYSQNLDIDRIHSDRTFSEWALNKYSFYKAFGDKLIYECGTVKLQLSLTEQENLKKKIIHWISEHYYDTTYGKRVIKFIEALSVNELFSNSLETFHTVTTYEEEVKTLSVGAKPLRAIKLIMPYEAYVRRIQDKISEYIQKTKVEGVLCLSIHPLDFLSLSENASNWRSCHSLDGNYRAGNLSYLMDTSTIIAYIKSPVDKEIPRFPFDWNDKKWRNLLFFNKNKDIVMAGRPYPFESFAALKEVEKALKEIPQLNKAAYSGWQYRQVSAIQTKSYNPETETFYETLHDAEEFHIDYVDNRLIYDPQYDSVIKLQNLVWNEDRNFCHYNDLLYSSCYFPFYSHSAWAPMYCYNQFEIGHEAYCLINEDEIITKNFADRLICEKCVDEYESEWQYCDCCGRHVAETIYVEANDCFVCEDCYREYVVGCDKCGVPVLEYTARQFANDDRRYCINCYTQILEEELEEEEEENANGSSECE